MVEWALVWASSEMYNMRVSSDAGSGTRLSWWQNDKNPFWAVVYVLSVDGAMPAFKNRLAWSSRCRTASWDVPPPPDSRVDEVPRMAEVMPLERKQKTG